MEAGSQLGHIAKVETEGGLWPRCWWSDGTGAREASPLHARLSFSPGWLPALSIG
jgi:hypothetical protein